MKRIYIPLFAVYLFLGATALVAEEAAQPTVEAAVTKPDVAKKGVPVADAKPGDDDLDEVGWPREYQHEDGDVVLYQPQLDEWKDHATLTAKAAVSVQFKGSDEFHYGALYFKATTEVDKVKEEVLLDEFVITKMHFPDTGDKISEKAGNLVTKAISVKGSMVMALGRLVAELEADSETVREVDLNLDPPPIFYSDKPAILLGFMGDPSFKPIEDVDGLMFAVNTNWDLLQDVSTSTYYLLNGESWMETADPVKGPWKNTEKLPDLFNKLPDDENWKDVKEHIPGKAPKEQPQIIVATQPSELIVTDGEPAFDSIAETKLMYVTNTNSDLFFDNTDKKFYFLTAGRWFRAEKLEGPWKAASADLPAEFANIPEDHKKNSVLNAVPGTKDAEAAVLLANVPQKATVSRKDTTIKVAYEGEPDFVEIKGTSPAVSYAINSPNDVFQTSGLYYALVDGVWFVGSTPTGPWAVATEVDEAIYSIPEDSPKYNATYVRVYDYTDDDVVVGYTSGYYGNYVAETGVLMFGLGLWAGSYWGDYGYYGYPSYYGYGSGMRYGYGYGYYRGGDRYYGPYGGISGRAGYNPRTGRYYRGGVAQGPYGSAFARTSYNPRTNSRTTRAGGRTPYGSWGRSVTANGGNWTKAGHRSLAGKTIAGAKGSGGRAVLGGYNRRTGEGFKVAKGKNNNLFVGKDGGVYKRNGKNDWSKHSGKDGWKKSNVGKLDAKDRRSVRSREGGVGESRGAGALAEAGAGALAGAGAAGALAGARDRKGGKAGVKDRKAGAANKSLKQQQRSKTAISKSASKAKPAARKQMQRSTDNAKLAARITSPQKYYSSSRNRGSGASTRNNLNRSYSTRSSGNRRATNSSRNRSSSRSRSSGRSMGGGGRSMRGGGGRGGGGRGGGGRR